MCSSTCATAYGTVFLCCVSSVYDVNLELIHFTCSSPTIFPRKKISWSCLGLALGGRIVLYCIVSIRIQRWLEILEEEHVVGSRGW
mmetsp:Transcript_14432/g.16377  ORF Transcript_14432/g.16377 Transcript_14432/m.16377 type:complete len:86 (-) Transcript_14432:172-429(-)